MTAIELHRNVLSSGSKQSAVRWT